MMRIKRTFIVTRGRVVQTRSRVRSRTNACESGHCDPDFSAEEPKGTRDDEARVRGGAGAIADETSLEVLRDMREDSKHREVRETASLALRRVEYMVGSRDESTTTSTTTATNNTTFNNSTGAIVGSKKESIGKVAAVNEEQEEEFAYSVDPVPAMDESIETETLAEIILGDAGHLGPIRRHVCLAEPSAKDVRFG